MIIIQSGNLLLAGMLLANDFITIYFPEVELSAHYTFYLVTFFTYLGFCEICLSYLACIQIIDFLFL
jgi:hypothetical protein